MLAVKICSYSQEYSSLMICTNLYCKLPENSLKRTESSVNNQAGKNTRRYSFINTLIKVYTVHIICLSFVGHLKGQLSP